MQKRTNRVKSYKHLIPRFCAHSHQKKLVLSTEICHVGFFFIDFGKKKQNLVMPSTIRE